MAFPEPTRHPSDVLRMREKESSCVKTMDPRQSGKVYVYMCGSFLELRIEYSSEPPGFQTTVGRAEKAKLAEGTS